jgi:26S proteasome regulatory subunit T1
MTSKEEKKKANENKDGAKALDETDIDLLKRYGRGPYFEPIKKLEEDLKEYSMKINKLIGVKESDTGLSAPSEWFLAVSIRTNIREIRR